MLRSTEQYGVNSSHIIFPMRPSNLEGHEYVSDLSVLGIDAPHIGYRMGATTTRYPEEGGGPHDVPDPSGPLRDQDALSRLART